MTPLPTHLQAEPTAAWIFTAVGAIFFVASLAWALRESARESSRLPLLALAGGAIAALEEGWIDRIIQLWYPLDSPLVMFTALGIPQPLYVALVYPGFIGLGAYVCYRGLLKYPDGRLLWPTFFGIVAMDFAFEVFATWTGVFYYYGEQPFQLVSNGWPMWVAPVNATGPLLAGWMIYRLEPQLRGPWRGFIVLIPPLAYAGVYGASSWPVCTAMNSQAPAILIWLSAILTMSMCVLIVTIMRRVLRSRNVDDAVTDGMRRSVQMAVQR